jgi:phage FluMu protein Com
MLPIRCKTCGKLLLEASGEVKKICPKCKTENHVVTTSQGIIQLNSK